MMASEEDASSGYSPATTSVALSGISLRFHSFLDKTTLWVKWRWMFFLLVASLILARMVTYQGFFVITYAWGVFLLNALIGFLSPQVDPETETYVLPVRDSDDYRPFQRRLPEFQFWKTAMKASLLSLCLMCYPVFDLPVFWPILLIYFILLFVMTIKKQILHMLKHRYVPFDFGKQTYGEITRNKKGAPGSKGRHLSDD